MRSPVATTGGAPRLVFALLAVAACEASSLPRGQSGLGGGPAGAGGGAAAGTGALDAGFGGAGGQVSCLYINRNQPDVELDVSGTPDAGTPSENCPTTDTPPSDPAALRVYDLVEANQHALLQHYIGQYVCGTGWIYRGTFAAHDNSGSTPIGGAVDGVINSGPVIAAVGTSWSTDGYKEICTQPVTGGVRALLVIASAQSKAIRLFQVLGGDGTTYSSVIQNPGVTVSGASGACDGCVADLRGTAPASLSIGPVTMTGQYCDGMTPLEVTVSGQLTILPTPAAADILEMYSLFPADIVAPAPPPFAQQGNEMVATVNGTLYEIVDPVLPTGTATPFHVDWYVNSRDVTLFGLRNFRIDATLPICANTRPPGQI
jgi:hypothetical protein